MRSFLKNYWSRLPQRQRLLILALATGAMAVFATILLVRNGLKEVLYKGF
jgi:flagellar biosynthesis/type III secretory pathway M-ring protein FliF/YscJ